MYNCRDGIDIASYRSGFYMVSAQLQLLDKQEEAIRERNKNVEPKVKEHFDKGIKLHQDFITVSNIHAIRNRIDELAQSHDGEGNIRDMKGYSKLISGSQKMEDYLYRQGGDNSRS